MNINQIKTQITNAFKQYVTASINKTFDPIPKVLTSGKLYESYILGHIAKELTTKENLKLILTAGTRLWLRSSPGPIDRTFPGIEVHRSGKLIAEIWTDIEFLTFSYSVRGNTKLTQGDYHELDIMMVNPGLKGRPTYDMVWLGVECKNTGYSKSLLKEILGIRRELSLLQNPQQTQFRKWPRKTVPADPPSCLLVYSTDSKVINYSAAGNTFGIDFFHEPM
jgi:hypothetical protein